VAAVHLDRRRRLLHHDEVAAAHVTSIGLQQERTLVARRGQPGAIVEDAPVAAVGGVPHHVARALRVSPATSHRLLRALVTGTEPTKWKPVIQTGLRLIVAKAESLIALVTSETAVEEALQLLGIRDRAELDFCVSLARADYALDLAAFQQEARAALDQNPQGPASEELRHLRERLEQLQKETLHVDDVRAMLNGIMDSLVARGVPLELLTRTLSSVLPEWVSFPLP